jgi:putative Holliday junction resolvase
MRVLGIDYGDKAVGLAVSDDLGIVARGLPTVIRDHTKKKWVFISQIKEIVDELDIKAIVIGFPINTNFTIGQQGQKTLEFKDKLANQIPGVEIILRDERFTTAIAERVLLEADVSRRRRGQVVDKIAAVVILQGYLDEKRR